MSKRSKGMSHYLRTVVVLPKRAAKRFHSLHRNTKLAVSLVGVLVLAGVWTAVIRSDSGSNATQEIARNDEAPEIEIAEQLSAQVTYAEGVVEYRNADGEWVQAVEDTELTKESGIRTTGASSRAIIELEDGSIVRVDANTEIIFTTISESRVIIEQKSGQVYHRVVEKEGTGYLVTTENARFQSEGTAFRTIASGDEEAVEVFQSSVKETSSNATVKEGEKYIAKHNVNSDLDGVTERIDIERLKQDSFITWNRDQDSAIEAFKNSLGFLKDFDGPKIEVNEPAAGSTIEIADGQTTGTVKIKGKTEARATLTIQSKSVSGSQPVNVSVGDDGSFESDSLPGASGTSVFELIAKDRVGNVTKTSISYNFRKKAALQETGIALVKSVASDGKITLSWNLVGITANDGVRVSLVSFDDDENVVDSKEYTVKNKTSYVVNQADLLSDTTYYATVCRIISSTGQCDNESNQVQFTTEP